MANPFDQAFRDLQADNAQQDGGDNPFDAAFAGLGPQAPADLGPRTAGTIAADTWAQFGAGANRMASGMSRLAGAAAQPVPENLGLADRARFAASTAGGALMDAFAGVMGLAEQVSPFNRAAAEMGMGFSAPAGGAADELGLRAAEIEAREAEAAQASGGRTLQQRREANVFNQLAEALSGYQAGYEEQLSPQAKARAQERAGAMESGPMELLQFLLTNPSHAIEVGVESLPTIVPGAALARGARALGAGQTAAQRLGEAGTVSTMTGASAGNVYQGVMELPDDQLQQLPGYADLASELGPEGAREALARQGMQAAIAFGAPVDAATVGLASRLGLNVVEQAAAGRGRLGSTVLGALSGAGREAAGEFPQGVGQQIAENVGQAAAGQRDRSNLTEGALEAGILEAFASLGPGAAFGAGSATSGEQARRARDTQDDAEVDAVLREQVAQRERDAQRMPPTRRTQMADAISQALAGESAPLQGGAESQADESDSLQQRNDDETAGSPSALSDVAEQVDARLAELEDQAAANERTPEQMRALRAERDQLRDLLREVEASEGVIPADPAGRMSSEERAAATDRMAEITAELEAAGAASAFRREADRIRERLDRTDTDGEFLAAAESLGFRPRQAAPRAPAPAPQRAEAPKPAAPTSSPAAAAFAGETEGAGTGSREDLISRWRAARTPRERADAAAALAAFNQQETRDGQAEAEEGAVPQGRQAQPDTGAEQPGPVSSRGQADSAPPAPGRARVTGDDRARRTAIGREIERVVSGLEDAPGVQFHVDTSTIPGEIASRAEAAGGIDSGVEAFYDPATDTIHVVIGNITGGRRRGGWVAEHEVGHVLLRSYAMRGDNDLRTIVERAAQNDAVALVLRAMADQRPETDSLLQEEALVELMTATRTGNYGEIESRYGVTVPQAMRDDLIGAMRRVLQRIRTWLANHGITSAPTMSDAEVFDIMQRAFAEGRVAERANRGGTRAGRRRRAGGDDVVAQRAFHGTPQREIDAFSLNRIGTGEGNQAFGWGLYFASRRDVADAYRGALTGVNRRPGGRLADESIQRRGSRAEAIRELTALRDRAATPARRTEYQQAIDFIRSGVNRGQTYAVEVPENDVLLDYDAPLSQQPQAVQDAVRALEADGRIAPGTLDADPSGAVIYSALGEPQEASRLLREAGIPGLRYLDGGSRAAGDGTHNFVIWDEALIGVPEPLVASRRDPQTETPEFRRWFGDSKVVDENGEPLVVYHGTGERFDVFEAGEFGFHFGDSTAAEMMGDPLPVYLAIRNPLRMPDLGVWSPSRVLSVAHVRGGLPTNEVAAARAEADRLERRLRDRLENDSDIVDQRRAHYEWSAPVRRLLERHGFDGIVYRNEAEGFADSYIAFRPEQIKSAIGNRGTFDPADPRITFSRRDPSIASSRALEAEILADFPDVRLDLYQRGNDLTLSRIVVPEGARSEGTGTQIMQRIVDHADREGLRVLLTPSADFGGNVRRLREFYSRFGFRNNTGRSRDFTTQEGMIRDPRRTDEALEAVDGGQPLFSRRTPSEANMERAQLLSRLAAEGYAEGPVVPMQTPGRFAPLDDRIDAMRIKLQDKMLAVRRAQERAARGAPRQPGITTATLDDAMNAYRLENLMHGRVQDRLRGLDAELLTPLMKQLRRTGRSVAQLEDYLLARHAEERNARIASINPAMQDAGAGITTQMASDILAGREAGPYSGKRLSADDIAILESAAQKVDRMVAVTRDTLEEAGLISPELANALRSTYSNYVPLRGYEGQGDEVTSGRSSGTGGGVTPGRANVRRAGGRGDMNLAQDILGEVVGDMQRAVVQAEKSRVAQSFLRFAMANPMQDLFTIEPVDLEWKFSESTGEAYLGVVNRAEDMGTSLVVPHNGTMVRIRFEDQRLADAMLNLNLADMSWFVQNIGAINRWRSAVLTRWNPSFFFVNLLRDAQFGMVGIAAERGIATAAQAAANYAPAFAALVRDNYSRSGDSSVPDAQKTMADWAREYAEAGAKTGIVLSEEVTDLQRKLSESATKIMQLAAEGKPLRAARQSLIRYGGPIIETIENFNDASENAIRLSAYVAMRKQGTSIEQAAEYAKNLTINFNRKGEFGPTLNALYLFYNAAMQGAHAVFRVMRNPGVQAFLGGMAGLQYLAALAMMGDDDDDGITDWDTVPDYVKRTSLVIPLGHFTGDSQDYFALPMPYGFNVVPYAGGRLAQYAHSGSRPTDPSVTADLVASITESFSPIPLQDGYRSLFGDTIGFFMGMAMNEDDMGRPIARENPYAQYDVPKALEGNVTTPRAYHVTSQILAKLGGGDLERREAPVGYLDIAPEQIKEMVEFMAGGLGNIANKSARFYEQMSAGNLESAMDVIDATPIASRFIGKGKTHRAVADRYYGEMGELARGLDRLRDRVASDPDNAEQALEDLRREEPALEGIEFDRFRANTRSGGRRGEIRTSPDGSPRFQPMPGSAFESRREAEREVTDINRSIRRLRTPGMTNADVVDMLGQMPPRADLPASERPVLEALGLPQDFDAEAQAPNRVRQRAIRMLQDQRMRSQQDFLRDLESDRRRARE